MDIFNHENANDNVMVPIEEEIITIDNISELKETNIQKLNTSN